MDDRRFWLELYRQVGLGHPVHVMVVHFPMAFLLGAVALDAVRFSGIAAVPERFVFWLLTAGVATALGAALTGFIELFYLPEDPAVENTALVHLGLMLGAVLLYGINWMLWLRVPGFYGSGWYGLVSASGAGLLLAGAWFGGELVFGFGVEHEDAARDKPASSEG